MKTEEQKLSNEITRQKEERVKIESLHKKDSFKQEYQLKVAKLKIDQVRLQQQKQAQNQKWMQIQSKNDLDRARQEQVNDQNDQLNVVMTVDRVDPPTHPPPKVT